MKKQKSATTDFTPDLLPKNRKEVFFDCIKIRYRTLFFVGLILTAFILPYIICSVSEDLVILSALGSEKAEEETLLKSMYSIEILFGFIKIPCFVIFSVGLAGCVRIIRQIVWGEGVFVWQDFKLGVKNNAKMYALVFFAAGLIGALCTCVADTFLAGSAWALVPLSVCTVVLLPAAILVCAQVAIYNNRWYSYIKNAFLMYLKKVPVCLLGALCLALPLLVGQILDMFSVINFVWPNLALAVYTCFIFPFILTGVFLSCCYIFDIYINKDRYPEIYKKGIYHT